MSSTNKTGYLNLNAWVGADIPKMADFNSDNEMIDAAMEKHDTDSTRHLTAEEREKWNTPLFVGTYIGDDSETRTIGLNCGFVPSFLVVFANSTFIARTNFDSKVKENYFACGTMRGGTAGLTVQDTSFTVRNDAVAVIGNELRCLNKSGTTYTYIVFR